MSTPTVIRTVKLNSRVDREMATSPFGAKTKSPCPRVDIKMVFGTENSQLMAEQENWSQKKLMRMES